MKLRFRLSTLFWSMAFVAILLAWSWNHGRQRQEVLELVVENAQSAQRFEHERVLRDRAEVDAENLRGLLNDIYDDADPSTQEWLTRKWGAARARVAAKGPPPSSASGQLTE